MDFLFQNLSSQYVHAILYFCMDHPKAGSRCNQYIRRDSRYNAPVCPDRNGLNNNTLRNASRPHRDFVSGSIVIYFDAA